jgi:hypothetical protein
MSPPNGIIQRALTLRYNGRRDKGRPRRRWIYDIADATASRYTIWHCHVLSISTFGHEASRDREINQSNKEVLVYNLSIFFFFLAFVVE